jgi:hypothetical protein
MMSFWSLQFHEFYLAQQPHHIVCLENCSLLVPQYQSMYICSWSILHQCGGSWVTHNGGVDDLLFHIL